MGMGWNLVKLRSVCSPASHRDTDGVTRTHLRHCEVGPWGNFCCSNFRCNITMWRDRDYPDPQYNASSVHPNLKNNFNPYEILQPQKLPMNGSLIDLGISGEATCLRPINVASNTNEKGFSNIDLLENILVTPQLVNNQPTIERNIDFEDFFNKLESGTKCDWVKSNTENIQIENRTDSGVLSLSDKKTHSKELEIDSLFDEIVKNKCFSERETFSVPNNYEDMTNQEDIIEEVLLEKTMEKITLSDVKPTEYNGQVKIWSTPKVITDYEHNGFERFKTNNNFNPTASNNVKIILNENMNHPKSKNYNANDKMFLKTNIVKLNNEYNNEARKESNFNAPKFQNIASHSNIASPSHSDKKQSDATNINFSVLKSILEDESLKSNIKNPHKPINRKFAIKETPISPELLSKSNQKYMTKDAKHFAKYYMPNNDPNKYSFTPGPSYEEKIIALPNILKRLNEQKQAYELKKNMPRRLILDEGVKRNNKIRQITDLNPTYLKEDCNKERLEAYIIGKKFENFLKNGSHF